MKAETSQVLCAINSAHKSIAEAIHVQTRDLVQFLPKDFK